MEPGSRANLQFQYILPTLGGQCIIIVSTIFTMALTLVNRKSYEGVEIKRKKVLHPRMPLGRVPGTANSNHIKGFT